MGNGIKEGFILLEKGLSATVLFRASCRIFQILSEMQLTKMKEEFKEEQKVYGSCSMKIVTRKEQILVVFQGDTIEINGIFYKCSSQRNDWMNALYDCFR